MRPDRRRAAVRSMFETRSHSWQEAGLARQLNPRAVRRAKQELLPLLLLIVGVILIYDYRRSLFGVDEPVRIATCVALVILGWTFARAIGRSLGPSLMRRMDPSTAGTVGFLVRLLTIAAAVIAALRIAGIKPQTLAVGGAFTAVVLGLAAQQTLGNLIAGTVLLSARPFTVGERVRLQGGGLAGQVEGVVSSLGLLYTTFASGDDSIMVPNSVVLNVAIVPLREPAAVDLRARLPVSTRPSDVQKLLQDAITVPIRGRPDIELREVDGEEVVVRLYATPVISSDGPRLADEILGAIEQLTRGGGTSTSDASPAADGAGRPAGSADAASR